MLIILAFFLGLVASTLSNIAAGGGALVVLPVLLALGIEPLTAVGTIKFGGIGLIIGSIIGGRGKGVVRKDYLWPMLFIAIAASIIGPLLSINVLSGQVKLISSILIIFTAIVSLASFRLKPKKRIVSPRAKYGGFLLYFILTVILASFGSGIGLLSSYVLILVLGMTPIEAIGTRRVAGVVGLPIQLILFFQSGHINLPIGLALLAGSIIGAQIGLRVSLKHGNVFVRRAMSVAAIALVLSLFL